MHNPTKEGHVSLSMSTIHVNIDRSYFFDMYGDPVGYFSSLYVSKGLG